MEKRKDTASLAYETAWQWFREGKRAQITQHNLRDEIGGNFQSIKTGIERFWDKLEQNDRLIRSVEGMNDALVEQFLALVQQVKHITDGEVEAQKEVAQQKVEQAQAERDEALKQQYHLEEQLKEKTEERDALDLDVKALQDTVSRLGSD